MDTSWMSYLVWHYPYPHPDTTHIVTLPAAHIDTTLIPVEILTVSPIIPSSPNYTPTSPDYSLASDTKFDPFKDPSSDHIPPLLATLLFLSSTDDSSDRDTPNTPPSPTYVQSITRSSAATERLSHSSVAGPSHKRSRSPTIYVSISLHIPGALSSTHADLLPPPKRIRSFDFVTNLEGCLDESSVSSVPRETSLRDNVVVSDSDEPHLEHDIDPEIQAEINECIPYADALRARGIDARVVVEAVDQEEIKTGTRGLVKVTVKRVTQHAMPNDIPEPAQEEGAVEVTYKTLET
nr:hypothetical protein [Tanacetum cinerariifolium]